MKTTTPEWRRRPFEWLTVLVMLTSLPACFLFELGSDDDEVGSGGDDTVDEPPGEGMVCDPSEPPSCTSGLTCCSDDPAAFDLAMLDALVTPSYEGTAGNGIPLFSGSNNSRSAWGTCTDVSEALDPGTLIDTGVQGCPIPCNPTWTADDVEQVCGSTRQCCQTRAIEFADCVLDPTIGDAGCWRPVTGNDITGLGGIDATLWQDSAHATEQGPSGRGCIDGAGGVSQDMLDLFGVTAQEVQLACIRRLSVANQRGYCTDAGTSCAIDPATPDACQLRNVDELRTDCAELVP